MTDNTFTRVDPLMVHDALLYGPHRQDAADYACAALRAAYAEIDRLRDTPPVWAEITNDPRSYPKSGARVVLQIGNGTSDGVVARRDAVVDYSAEDGTPVSEVETWFMERTGNQLSIRPGDRWAYIPEAPHADN